MTLSTPFTTLDESAVEIAAARSYVYEAHEKDIQVIGWKHESEETRETWRKSVRVAVRSYLNAAGIASLLTELKQSNVEIERLRSGGIGAIAVERNRQIIDEGWTAEHDDDHAHGEIANAAAVYALAAGVCGADRPVMDQFRDWSSVPYKIQQWWPWATHWLKPKSRRDDLIKAGALIAAEIDRLDRAALKGAEG